MSRRRCIRFLATTSFLVASLLPAGTAFAEQGTITLLGHLNLPEDGLNTDVCGYVDAADKEYALVGNNRNFGGFHIIDVTVPGNPTMVRGVSGVNSFDLKVWGNHVYTTSGRRGEIAHIVDITWVFAPVTVGTFPSSHNIFIDSRGYMHNSYVGAKTEFATYDVHTDPTQPALVWADGRPDAHDAAVVGNTLYLFHGGIGTRVYDITNPASPSLITEITGGGISYHHSGWPTKDGKYLFICDELAKGASADITVWNIENPASPTKVASIYDPISTVHNLYIIGDYAYVSYYKSGFRVFDVTDPEQPFVSDEFDTSPLSGEGYAGAFGCYPFAPSGNIYITDMELGLFVFAFAPPTSAVAITRFVADYDNGAVRLEWDIGAAEELEGFNVYRSQSENAGYVPLNTTLLPAQSGFAYVDDTVEPGATYWYQLGAIDRDGEFRSQRVSVTIPARAMTLYQNVPNPFNPSTTIAFELASAGRAALEVFNARGEKVRTLLDEFRGVGAHTVVWDGTSDASQRVSSGVYYYRLRAGNATHTRRMILLK